jgi:hypothetical protein
MTHLDDDTLNAYLDETLPAAAYAEATAHLQACTACASRLNSLTALFTSLETLPDLPLARDLSPLVVAAIRPKPILRPVISPTMRLAFAFQLLLAIGALAAAIPFATKFAVYIPTFNSFDFMNTTLQGFVSSFQTLIALPQPETLIPADLTTLLTQLPVLPISTALIAACLAGVTVLWLIGNSVLLRPMSRSGR